MLFVIFFDIMSLQ